MSPEPAGHALYDVAWEVCHRIGGVHTVLAGRAAGRVRRLGEDYVCVGPWLLAEPPQAFEDDPAGAAFAEGCRQAGLPVRVGHWAVPGRPRTLLVDFSGLIAEKDRLLGDLWDRHRVDSLGAGWDYLEPLLFGIAAARVIERWHAERVASRVAQAIVQAHDWTAAGAVLEVARLAPGLATLFQAHSLVLALSLARAGRDPLAVPAGEGAARAAEDLGVRAQHSLEGAAARSAYVFTTVSEPAAEEAARLHGRTPAPLLPNLLDTAGLAQPDGEAREATRRRVRDVLARLLGEEVRGARLLVSAGRYDLRLKGLDVLLEALARLAGRAGPPVVALLIVPAAAAGVSREAQHRLEGRGEGPAVFHTHALFEPESDPLFVRARELGLTGSGRVRVLHVPVYVDGHDGVFNLGYAGLLGVADVGCFPSAYETWGFTPQECLAVGVPTITSDATGFARFLARRGLVDGEAVSVLARRGKPPAEVVEGLAALLERALARERVPAEVAERCRRAAGGVLESEVLAAQAEAFAQALAAAAARAPALGAQAGQEARPTVRVQRPQGTDAARPHLVPLDVPSRLPAALAGLHDLAWNWRWAWHAPTQELFATLDAERLQALRGNPQRLLAEVPQQRLDALAADPAFVARVEQAARAHAQWMEEGRALAEGQGIPAGRPVAYLCAEYALHASLPIYSGGLGVLAADHLRAASDLGLPLVAVGLLYRQGYFRQHLEGGLQQVAQPEEVDPASVPLERVRGADGSPLELRLPLPGGEVALGAWRAQVGRVPLYLLDADLPANRPEDRAVTHVLYGGDAEMRLRQELVLGRGGVRLLEALGLRPSVLHVNEGHGAFAALERIGALVRGEGLSWDEARLLVRLTTAFTTHTPVPAGHDRFDEDLLRRWLSDVPGWLGIDWERFMRLGSVPGRPREFNMTALATRLAGFVNGVSQRHAEVTRPILRAQAPWLLADEVPVQAITNGVHLEAWTAPEVARALGAAPGHLAGEHFAAAGRLDLGVLHGLRDLLKQRLLARMRAQLEGELAARADPAWLRQQVLEGLAPHALWIGFARRFATYKRAGLLLGEPERLRALLDGAHGPVRLVLAGKAHPRDREGQELIARIARLARSKPFAGRIFFLEGYDLELARLLVQGVDLWLNTPRPPLEASGTSGMKAAANGGLQASTPDGWWLEGYDGRNGWMVGSEAACASDEARDRADTEALYRLLEQEVLPLWARREAGGLPRAWLERARHALQTLPPRFDAQRMVEEYRQLAYAPQATRRLALEAGGHAALRSLAAGRRRIREGMGRLRVLEVEVGDPSRLAVGSRLEVSVRLELGGLAPGDVRVELLLGERSDTDEDLRAPQCVRLAPAGGGAGVQLFRGGALLERSGRLAYGVRVRPCSEEAGLSPLHEPGLWA
ncbi:MAG: alpha-glucan family phosphorylase [Planctomycetia bacterium]